MRVRERKLKAGGREQGRDGRNSEGAGNCKEGGRKPEVGGRKGWREGREVKGK